MDCQDWEEVKVGRRVTSGAGRAAGITVVPKFSESAIRQVKSSTTDADGVPKPLKKHLSSESRQQMIKKRIELGLNQVKLNQQCAFPPNTIRDFENGSSVPTGAQLNVMSRILGIRMKLD